MLGVTRSLFLRQFPLFLGALLLFLAAPGFAEEGETPADDKVRRVHVIVALCDNDSQGIQPVPARIGDGDDLENNLYWGCSEGLKRFFQNSSRWELVSAEVAEDSEAKILETCVFRHKSTGALLTAEAWRGREIQAATEAFFEKLKPSTVSDDPNLVAYIGHNGLMDFRLPFPEAQSGQPSASPLKDAIVLCCVSRSYFGPRLEALGVRPILLTEQLMYPGSFLLEAAVEGWLKEESAGEIRERAARAYHENQQISVRAARGIFSEGL